MLQRLAIIFILSLLGATACYAQLMMRNFGQGSQSSAPSVACTNQLVLDYSNSCALIGQGFGQ